ncbi:MULTISPECIES: hypothetical protein [unclassified Bradyrhizobium]|uniref:hypothetical protein n=1 Tax=unclassified Bradyrhizobium TaxID=2631580 RepID=UPI0028EE4CCA|nr:MULTISPECIES: hypothetical protein [unclassified Bradyrhizobium]
MFDPLAVISLQQNTPGLADTGEPPGGIQDHSGKRRVEGHKAGLDLRAGINWLADQIARRLRSVHDLSYASARDPH